MADNVNNRLTKDFNDAVDAFWDAYASYESRRQCLGARGKLLDAADRVLFARDALYGKDLVSQTWDTVTHDIVDVAHALHKNDIVMNAKPVPTSTGRMTYRLITKPRFDA